MQQQGDEQDLDEQDLGALDSATCNTAQPWSLPLLPIHAGSAASHPSCLHHMVMDHNCAPLHTCLAQPSAPHLRLLTSTCRAALPPEARSSRHDEWGCCSMANGKHGVLLPHVPLFCPRGRQRAGRRDSGSRLHVVIRVLEPRIAVRIAIQRRGAREQTSSCRRRCSSPLYTPRRSSAGSGGEAALKSCPQELPAPSHSSPTLYGRGCS